MAATMRDGPEQGGKEELFVQSLRKIFESLINSAALEPSCTVDNDTFLSNLLSSDQGQLVVSCIVTLCKILDNILLESKYNPKTRTIKLSNRLFRDKIGTVPGGVDFLLACDFRYTYKKNGNGEGSNASPETETAVSIKLQKEYENKDTLLTGRLHLHVLGVEVLGVGSGKTKNDLPTLRMIYSQDEYDEIKNNTVWDTFLNQTLATSKTKSADVSSGSDENQVTVSTISSASTSLIQNIDTPKKNFSLELDCISPIQKCEEEGEGGGPICEEKVNVDEMMDHPDMNMENDDTFSRESFALESSMEATGGNSYEQPIPELTTNEKAAFDSIVNYAGHQEDEDEDEMILSVVSGKENHTAVQPVKDTLTKKLQNIVMRTKKKTKPEADVQDDVVNDDESKAAHSISNLRVSVQKTDRMAVTLVEKRRFDRDTCLGGIEEDEAIGDYDIDRIKFSSDLSYKDADLVKLALKLFFSAVVVTCNQCEQIRLETSIQDTGSGGECPYIPLELAYMLWLEIVQRERMIHGMEYEDIFQRLMEVAGEAAVPELTALKAEDSAICAYICDTLSVHKLLEIEQYGGNQAGLSSGTMIRVNRRIHRLYGEELAIENFAKSASGACEISFNVTRDTSGIDSIEVKKKDEVKSAIKIRWQTIMVNLLQERLKACLDPNEDYTTKPVGSKEKIYTLQWLPFHMTEAYLHKEASSTLLDRSFMKQRFESLGVLVSTIKYVNDSTHLFDKSTVIVNESYDEPILNDSKEATYDGVLTILQDLKKHLDHSSKPVITVDLTMSSELVIDELGYALHHLANAYGIICRHQKERDLYVEALRFKRVRHSEESIAETYIAMGSCYQKLNDIQNAMIRYKEALSIYDQIFGGKHRNMQNALYNMGTIYCQSGHLNAALQCFNKSLKLSQGDDDEWNILSWIGKIHRERNEHTKALQHFQQARSSFESKEERNLLYAEIMQNLGVLYDDVDNHVESLKCFQECLRIRREKLGDDHEDVCETLTCMGNLLRQSDHDKAIRIYKMVLTSRLKHCKASDGATLVEAYQNVLDLLAIKAKESEGDKRSLHEEIVVLLFDQGYTYEKLLKFDDAIMLYNKCLKIKSIKKQYKDMGTILNCLGIAHAKRKSYEKAMKCFTDSLLLRKVTEGTQDSTVAESYHNLGNCATKCGLFSKAAEYYQQSLIIKRSLFGEKSLTFMKTLYSYGLVKEEAGETTSALKCYEDVQAVRTQILGETHIDVAFSMHSVGKIYNQMDDYEKASEYLRKALDIKRKYYGDKHVSVAETMYHLAIALKHISKEDESIEYLERSLKTFEKDLNIHIYTADAQHVLGCVWESKGEFDVAYRYLERALLLRRMILGNDHLNVADSLYHIGKVQVKSGDDEDALASFKEVLRVRKKKMGKDSLGVAAVINNTGVIQLRRGEYEIAKSCFVESMRIFRMLLEDNHENIGETLLNLGEIEYHEGNHDDAIEKFKEALDMFKYKLGHNHLKVGLVWNCLGRSYKGKAEYIDATEALEKSLSIRKTHLGFDSIAVAETMKDLGELYLEKKEIGKARSYLSDSLDTMTTMMPNDTKTADCLFLLGKVMSEMNYKEEAIAYFQDALEIRRRRLESDDLTVAEIQIELGLLHEKSKEYDLSLDLYQRALEIQLGILGKEELVADTHNSIGAIYQVTNELQLALKSFGAALMIYYECVGEEHISCAKTMNNIGIVYEAMSEYDEAMKYHKEALRLRQINLGKDNLKIACSLDNIAGLYQKQKNNDKALRCLKEALKIRKSHLGNEHLEVATTLFGLGIIFCDKEDFDKALECYEASLSIRKRKAGKSSIEVAQTIHNIGSVFALKQDFEKALEQWNRSLQKYREAGLPDDHHMVSVTIGNIEMAKSSKSSKGYR